jgi:tight adherence protein B
MSDAGLAARELAALLRAGHPLRAAISAWPATCPRSLRPAAERFARRVALGQDPEAAASVSLPEPDLRIALTVHRLTGGSLPVMLHCLARWHDETAALARQARAASAGAALSARIVAGLPLIGLLLLPASRAPIFDRVGVASLSVGLVLMTIGLRWIERLVPARRSEPDLGLMVAGFAAAGLRGGSSLHPTLDAIACAYNDSEILVQARRRVRLGQSWPASLRRAGDPGLERLAVIIERAQRTGIPAFGPLEQWAEARRSELATGFETQIGKAPVKMVVPLTLCVLPAFGLVAIVPFLRGLANA